MNKNDGSIANLDSELLRSFIVVARHGNVTHAARVVHKTQSAVSVQIRQLEERLRVKLFTREARGVKLTEAGETLLQCAEPIVRQLDQVAASFARAPVTGAVRVGIPDEYGATILPDVLAAFATQHPLAQVSVRCGFSVDFPDVVEKGQLDLAIYTSDHIPRSSGVTVLMEEETVWTCRKGFSFSGEQPVPLALFERSCWWRDIAVSALQDAGRSFRIAYSSDSVAGVKAAISSGLAAGMIARSTLEPGMQILKPSDGFPGLPVSHLLLLRGDAAGSAAVEAMSEAIVSAFAAMA
ncbi:LysR substrate-binding domain-containing protein [Pelagibius sp. Alg239-R121]|uniref:LysR substrate-binding domain-containing protein n=1 Tax=Pelagibius sp. Alg239-R121 TaxID=2993448 RepID=UPI0024A63319|nr:LysR substrate-binding domain-containing protein [Pelagibius sp. Alg239-R121]